MNPALDVRTHNAGDSVFLYALHPLSALSSTASDVDVGVPGPIRSTAFARWTSVADDKTPVLASPTVAGYLSPLRAEQPRARHVDLQRDPVTTVLSMRRFLHERSEESVEARARGNRARAPVLGAVRGGLAHAFHRRRWSRSGREGYIGLRPVPLDTAPELSDLGLCAWYFAQLRAIIDEGLAQIPGHRVHRFRHEELTADPLVVIRDLVDFVGGDTTTSYLDAAVGRVRRTSLTPTPPTADELAVIEHGLDLGTGVPQP